MKINAIIFGATGMVGEGVLLQALKHPDVESVLVIGRRSCGIQHPRMKEVIHTDFSDYASLEGQLRGWNACFFCLGVSSVGMKEVEYTRVTYDLTMKVATTLSRLNPDMTFCYVSGAGTDSSERGRSMWARVKGRTENELRKLPFKAAFAFRPGFMKPVSGQTNPNKMFNVVGYLYPLLKFLLPNFGCKLEDVGDAMIHVAKVGYANGILENNDIDRLARVS